MLNILIISPCTVICISFVLLTVILHNYFLSNCLPHDSIVIDRQGISFVIPKRVESTKKFYNKYYRNIT